MGTMIEGRLALAVLAAAAEELVFRGLLPRRLRRAHGLSRRGAAWVAAGAFAAAHLLNLRAGTSARFVLVQCLAALGFGLWAGRRRSLTYPAAVHIGVNLAAALGLCPVALYIDPGTGAMLFAILTGVLGVLRFALRGAWVKLRFLLRGGRRVAASDDSLPLVIFSDDKRYWPVFEPVCRALDERGFDVTYMTASPDDPGLECPLAHVHATFIGAGNRAFGRLNFLKATLLLSTTPGLDVYQWKRSRDVRCYVHLPHMPGELTTYRMFGTDYYDALLLSGQYQVDDCRALERLRGLPEKECVLVGIPYLDEKAQRLRALGPREGTGRTVLVAPSWGPNSLLNRFGRRLIDALAATGYHVIVRPHPQSFTSERELIEGLTAAYPDLEWNRDTDNFDVLSRSDVMISDFSGVIFDFALVFDRPVICAYADFDDSCYDAWWLDTPIWTATAIPRIGPVLSGADLPRLKALIDAAIDDPAYAEGRRAVRQETWAHPGEGAARTADYLIAKYRALTEAEPGAGSF